MATGDKVSITRSTYDCARFDSADAAFSAAPYAKNDFELYQVKQFGFGPHWYAVEYHRAGCCGIELYGYLKSEAA